MSYEPWNLVGHQLGQYIIRERLSTGALILSYRAEQPSLKRDVLVQTLADHIRDKQHQVALEQGAQFIARFEHPNIVPIIDYGVQDDIPYVVMRLMTGGTLRERLQEGVLSLPDVAQAVRQLAGALEYVHSLDMTHGDPAPTNIVFDAWGSAYFSDFLMSGFIQENFKGIMGVPECMAPERWAEQLPTPATDQYALATVAYRMITGHSPFASDNLVTLMQQHLHDDPPPPQTYRSEVPDAVAPVLAQALAKKPEERFPTVTDFARALDDALHAAPDHLFISYSRRDVEYAQKLKTHLQESRFRVWIDDQIEHGDQWFNQIHEAIQSAVAVLVVMTPEAEQSEWVQKEILLAKRYQKPIFPLLLAGQEFAILIDIQYGDVRGDLMPGADFHRRLGRVVYGRL